MGPIILNFSTPINVDSLKQGLSTGFEYNLRSGYIVSANQKCLKIIVV